MLDRLVITNSAWLIGDKVLRLGLGLFVWVWFARHFGPATFGIWNYAIAFASFFGAVATLGMDGVIVRELVRKGGDAGAILGTTCAMRLAAGVLAALAATVSVMWARDGEWLPVLLVSLNAAVFVIQSSLVLDFYFQARMRSRPTVIAMNMAYIVATLIRVMLLAGDAPIEWFGATLIVEAALAAGLLWKAYRSDDTAGLQWRISANVARAILGESWPMILSGLAVFAYMRLDQIMLSEMVGDEAVGQFSAALRIAEVWYFVPMAIMTAAFPAMVRRRQEGAAIYERYVQALYDGMAWLGLAIAVVTSITAHWVVPVLYGASYVAAASILEIQIWAGVAVAMSFVHSKWLLAEGLQHYGLIYTVAAASVNVTLNLMWIPDHGAIGAAWATLVAQFGPLLIQLLLPRARRNFVLMLCTLTAPYRAWKSLGPAAT